MTTADNMTIIDNKTINDDAAFAALVAAGNKPVSYTHLDVYKRQVWAASDQYPHTNADGSLT